jgi:hypothetical protein
LSYNPNAAGAYIDNTYPITSGQAWGDIYFRQNNGTGTMLTRMTIKADGGNVGIGTASPTAELQVNKASDVVIAMSNSTSITSGNRGNLAFYNSDISTVALIRASAVTDNVGTQLEFYTRPAAGSLTQVLTLASTGAATFSSSVTADSQLSILGSDGGGKKLYFTGGTTKYNFMIAAQENVNNALEITPSSAAGGSTFNNPAVVINSSGNVGIGTTNPGAKLEVVKDYAGSIEAEMANFYNPSQGNGNYNYITVGKSKVANNNAVFGFTQEASASRAWIGLWGDNVSGGVGLTVLKGGNVGIGTTSPVSKLDVAGAGYFSGESLSAGLDQTYTNVGLLIDEGDYIYTKDSSTTLRILMGKVADIIKIGQNGTSLIDAIELNPGTTGGRVSIFDDTTETVRFQNGNVGIGTTNPTVPLQIVKDNATISMTNTTAFAVDTGSRLFLGGKYSSGTSNNTTPFAWIVGAKENATDGNQAGYLSITTVANGGGFAERMRVTSTGNVGIGTTSPDRQLQIHESTSGTSTAKFTNSTTGEDGDTGFFVGINGSEQPILYGYNNTDMIIGTNGSERMRITSDGNVAINSTTTSGYRLYVNGSTWINGGTNFQDGVSIFRTESGAAEVMRIASNGNVGIGTATPGAKLHVAGDGRFEGSLDLGHGSASEYSLEIGASRTGDGFAYVDLIGDTTYPDYGLRMIRNNGGANTSSAITHRGTGSLLIETNEAAPIVFNTLAAERMRILSGGNVGIGTTTPTSRLTVTTATNAVDVLRLNNTGGDSGAVQGVTHLAINHFNGGTNPSTRITAYQDSTSGWPGGMYFSTRSLNTDSAPLERMRITSDGNVGIGTTDPQYMLDVNGDAQINAEGTGPAYAYVPDGAFGVDSLLTSGSENVALGKPDVWLRIHVDGAAFVFPGYQEP